MNLHYPTLYKYLSKILHMFFDSRATPLADDFVTSRSSKGDPAEFTLLSRLLEKSGSNLDVTDISAECCDHMVAGIDTTGDALCFLMWQLSQPDYLHYQDKIREELQSNHDARFDELPFLDAIVQEGLRCFPAIPMSLPRFVPSGGRTIDGYFVPENATVSSQAYSVNRYDQAVFPSPDTFQPERWLQPDGEAERKRVMFAFSHGGRGCVGKQ